MMDMVRKHCVEGTGNHDAAQACVDRTHEMLRMFKRATATFIPPRDNIDRVPLGASSASMYPGYSPADHIYGEAAAEYGAVIAEARRQGKQIERNPDGVEYVVGQSQLGAKEQLEELKKSRGAAEKSDQNDETSSGAEENMDGGPMDGVEQNTDAEQLFTVDSNPTPVSILQNKSDSTSKAKNKANDKAKRRVSFQDEQSNSPADTPEEGHKKKKVKVTEAESAQANVSTPLVEEDDISAEVDARHKAKEERRKRKEEKKRKRESGSSQTDAVEIPAEEPTAGKPTKKKQKKTKETEEVKQAAEPEVSEEQQPKKDKKKKKRASTEADAIAAVADVADETEKPKKKHNKNSNGTAA